jgi:hypothetical protein
VIGVDACFLRGRYKGQLMVNVGRDANNSIDPMSIVVVEAETKDNWTWFLEALISDIGTTPAQEWFLISNRQKVNILLFCTIHLSYLHEIMFGIFYLTTCAGPNTKPQTDLSYS